MSIELLSNDQISQVLAIIREAGKALMTYWPGTTNPDRDVLAVKMKEDGSPVSEADFASNEILTLGLSKLFVDDVIISEECAYPKPISGESRAWIIDPLDGTKSFIAGRDDFSILVALAVKHRIHGGFMLFPARGTLVWSVGDVGEPAALAVSQSNTIRPGHLYVAKMPGFSRPELKCSHIDSGLAFHQVATGELDGLIIRMDTHREWDIAAPSASILRAGGKITNEKGEPIPFGKSSKPCNFCVASNGRVHAELLRLIQDE